MSVFHCGMPPLCPRNWEGAQHKKNGGTLKKFPALRARVCAPNFKTVSAAMVPRYYDQRAVFASLWALFSFTFVPLFLSLEKDSKKAVLNILRVIVYQLFTFMIKLQRTLWVFYGYILKYSYKLFCILNLTREFWCTHYFRYSLRCC